MKFSDLKLSDGQITGILQQNGIVYVDFLDRTEKRFRLIFSDVLGMEEIGSMGADIDGGTVDNSDPFLEKVLNTTTEPKDRYNCFVIRSAHSDQPILHVVASDFSISK